MAVYRHIHVDYWQDTFILDLPVDEKYFYIYLMTNSKTTQSGIYEISKKIMEIETGFSREAVDNLIDKFQEYGKIIYSEETKEIFLKNWMKHNKAASPKVRVCIEKEIAKVKSEYLLSLFLSEYYKYGYSMDSLSDHYREKEKEEKKEEEKENIKKNIHKNKCVAKESKVVYVDKYANNLAKFKILYEQNVGPINDVVNDWLVGICEEFEEGVFKRAIEIATNKGKLYKSYINGILNQWKVDDIKTVEDLISRENSLKDNKGEKYARFNNESEEFYRKPTEEELREFEREFEKRA